MTLSELARLANVSVSVASKAFSGRGDVSEAMKEHVFSVARSHGCFHQFYNVPYDRRVVALIIPEAISKYYIKYVEEIKLRLESNNCTLLLSISNFDPDMERELIRYYCEHGKVDALVVVNGYCDFPEDDDIVFVKISGTCKNADVTVCSDKTVGLEDCLKTLRTYGHERIGFIGEPLTVAKQALLEQCLTALSMPVFPECLVTSQKRFEEAGADGVDRLLSLEKPPTALICSYGYITCGAIAELEARGVSIPDEISVVSFDPYTASNDKKYELTCIDYEIEELCEIATDKLFERFYGEKKAPPETVCVPERFYIGNTIAKII